MKERAFDWTEIRAKLASTRGEKYWRSLEELADTPAFQELVEREFPLGASELTDPVSRRKFLSLAAASLALAGVSACTRQPAEKIIPYVQPPEEIVPGEPLYFATAVGLRGLGTGVLVESHTGRPTKIEGNKKHPASLGFVERSDSGIHSRSLRPGSNPRPFATPAKSRPGKPFLRISRSSSKLSAKSLARDSVS